MTRKPNNEATEQWKRLKASKDPVVQVFVNYILRPYDQRGFGDTFFDKFAVADGQDSIMARAINAQAFVEIGQQIGFDPQTFALLLEVVYLAGSITKGQRAYLMAANENLRSYQRADGVMIQSRHTKDMDHLIGTPQNYDEVVAENLQVQGEGLQISLRLWPEHAHVVPGFWHLLNHEPEVVRGLRRTDQAYMMFWDALLVFFTKIVSARGDWAYSRSTNLEIARAYQIAFGLESLRPNADMEIRNHLGQPFSVYDSLVQMLEPMLFGLLHDFHADVEPREWLRRLTMAEWALQNRLTNCNPVILAGLKKDQERLRQLRQTFVPIITAGMRTGHFYVDRREFGIAQQTYHGTNLKRGDSIDREIFDQLPPVSEIPTQLQKIDEHSIRLAATRFGITIPTLDQLLDDPHAREVKALPVGDVKYPRLIPDVRSNIHEFIAHEHAASLMAMDPAQIPLGRRDLFTASKIVIDSQLVFTDLPFFYLGFDPRISQELDGERVVNFQKAQAKATERRHEIDTQKIRWIDEGYHVLSLVDNLNVSAIHAATPEAIVTRDGHMQPTDPVRLLARHTILRRQNGMVNFGFVEGWEKSPDLVQDLVMARRMQMGLEQYAAADPANVHVLRIVKNSKDYFKPSLSDDVNQLWGYIYQGMMGDRGDLSHLAPHINALIQLVVLSRLYHEPAYYKHRAAEARERARKGDAEFYHLHWPELQHHKLDAKLRDSSNGRRTRELFEDEIAPALRERLGHLLIPRHLALFDDFLPLRDIMEATQIVRRALPDAPGLLVRGRPLGI